MHRSREPGIDRLRFLAACFVVCIHVFPVLVDLNPRPPAGPAFPALLMYALVLCAVNCFGLISGYLGYREEETRIRWSSLLQIWLELVLFRVLFLLLPAAAGYTSVSLQDVFLPVTRRVNWYISAYFEMMLFAPLINRLVRGSSRGMNGLMAAGLLLFFCIVPLAGAMLNADPFRLDGGYSWMWLAALYYFGAGIKKEQWLSRMHTRFLWLGLAVCLILSALWARLSPLPFGPERFPGTQWKVLLSYPSITLTAASLCMLELCRRSKPGMLEQRWLRIAAPASLGVFLIHTTLFWLLVPLLKMIRVPQALAVPAVFAASLVVAVLCVLIDALRAALFRLIHVKALTDAVQARIYALCDALAARLGASE